MAAGMGTTMRQEVFGARRFIGKDISDVNGRHVGEAEDLILGVQNGCAQWAIVSTGGLIGIGEKYHIVPIQALSIDPGTGRVMLRFDAQRLDNGPMFDRNDPPAWSDENWARSVYSFYGMQYSPAGQTSGEMGMQGYTGPERRQMMGGYNGPERRHMMRGGMQTIGEEQMMPGEMGMRPGQMPGQMRQGQMPQGGRMGKQ